MKSSMTFAGLLEAFFTDRLVRQREVSRHTIVSYRETFRQLLGFAQERCKKPPSKMALEDRNQCTVGPPGAARVTPGTAVAETAALRASAWPWRR
jgi:site-specific recombinase XerC